MVDLHKLFYPENICLIGVSEIPIKGATAHCYALKKVGFERPIYCVNKNRDKVIFDLKAYHSILDVPEENIDYVIIGIPRNKIPKIIEDCNKKNVKFITIFSSGFSELGSEKDIKLEKEIVSKSSARIIGPNCLGPFCRDSKVTITEILEIPDQKVPAKVAFISQSGGHTGAFFGISENRGFPLNKAISIGNQCDLTIQDFLKYFADDKDIEVISCYIEQVKNGHNFCEILNYTSLKKPVIFWKGGQTKEGLLAASSHTGAISSSYEIFKSAVEQHGGIITNSMEELSDLTLGSLYLKKYSLGRNVAVMVPGGGSCVEMTDQAIKFGLNVPELDKNTQDNIQQYIQDVNTNTRNPIDLGVFGWLSKVYGNALKILSKDPNIDIIIFYMMMERIPHFVDRIKEENLHRSFLRNIKRAFKYSPKPFIVIIPNFNVNNLKITKYRKEFVEGLVKLRIPYFESMERAANVVLKLIKYQNWLKNRIKI